MSRARKGLKAPTRKHKHRRSAPVPMRQAVPKYNFPPEVEEGFKSEEAYFDAIGACDDGPDEIWIKPTPAEAEALASFFGTEGPIVAFGMSDNLKF